MCAVIMLALPIFPGRPSIATEGSAFGAWRRKCPVDTFRQNQHLGKKKTAHFRVRCMLALPIFPGSRPPSIVGANELNFCVRDGNRWTLIAINTNSYGWVLTHLLYYI